MILQSDIIRHINKTLRNFKKLIRSEFRFPLSFGDSERLTKESVLRPFVESIQHRKRYKKLVLEPLREKRQIRAVKKTKTMAVSFHETGSYTRRLRVRDPQKKRERRSVMLWICVGIGIAFLLHSILSIKEDSGGVGPTRRLLESSDCTSQPRWIEEGGVVLYFIGICYMFLGISIICDDYFVTSLETISEKLNLSADVAGATFMAAGSSAPELFSSFVALTNDRASNDIGVGTIVGSAVFNILVIIGVSVVFSGRKLKLDYRPIVRDGLFYAMAIAGVMGVFYDGKIYWWEGFISVFFYGVYILALKFNKAIMNLFPIPRTTFENFNANGVDLESLPYEYLETSASDEETGYEREVKSKAAPLLPPTIGETSNRHANNHELQDDQVGIANLSKQEANGQETEGDKTPLVMLTSKGEQVFWMLSFPWNICFRYTVPDCSKQKRKQWYILTFTMSIIWIGVISWFMVEWATRIGVPSEIMGVTVLAAGTSIPDAISSIAVAQEGQGDMAVANAVGSNVFDMWLGLGLPWLLVIPFIGDNNSFGKYIEVDNTELLPSVVILFGVLVFYFLFLFYTHWTLNKRSGQLFVALYIVYALYHIIAVWAFDIYHSSEDS